VFNKSVVGVKADALLFRNRTCGPWSSRGESDRDCHFFLALEKLRPGTRPLLHTHTTTPTIPTMTSADIDSKKRKRKHKSKKGAEVEVVEAPSNDAAPVAKPRKKSKKVHTPEPEIEEEVAQGSEDDVENLEEEDEEKLNQELKEIAAKAKAPKATEAEDSESEMDGAGSGANALAVSDLPSGTSIPTVDDPTRFDELNLSDRTMEAIKTMGFENMTEIQRKAIPPLLR
jgi:ATP-dependent RNA helicase DDX18/HAS1